MNSISHALAASYNAHSCFKFGEGAFELDAACVKRFAAAYAEIRSGGNRLAPSVRQPLHAACRSAVRDAFALLLKQCHDRFETAFLAELQVECERVMDEEIAWYGKKPDGRMGDRDDARSRAITLSLQSQRYFFGQLPDALVGELQQLAQPEVAAFRARVTAGQLRREDLSVNSGATVRRIRALLNQAFRRQGVLDAVSAYIGRRASVSALALELSVPQATWWNNAIEGLTRPPKTLYAHLDEGIAFPKSIVYLSDVDKHNGPTGCYPGAYEALELNPLQELVGRVVGIVGSRAGSPLADYYAKSYHQSTNSPRFRQHFMRLPSSVRFNSHLGWDVAPDSALEDLLAADEVQMTGRAGAYLVFDGARLLHRGGMVQAGERLALQVIFSDTTPVERIMAKVKRVLS